MASHSRTNSMEERWKNASSQVVRGEIQKKESYEEIKNMRSGSSVKDIQRMFKGKSRIETQEMALLRTLEAERNYRRAQNETRDQYMRNLKYTSSHTEKARFLKMWVQTRKQGGKKVTVEEGRRFLEEIGMLDDMTPGVSPTEASKGDATEEQAGASMATAEDKNNPEAHARPPLGWRQSLEIDDWMLALQEVVDHQNEGSSQPPSTTHKREKGGKEDETSESNVPTEPEPVEQKVVRLETPVVPDGAGATEEASIVTVPVEEAAVPVPEEVQVAQSNDEAAAPVEASNPEAPAVEEPSASEQADSTVVESEAPSSAEPVLEVAAVEEVHAEPEPVEVVEAPVVEPQDAETANAEEEAVKEQPVEVPVEEPAAPEVVEQVVEATVEAVVPSEEPSSLPPADETAQLVVEEQPVVEEPVETEPVKVESEEPPVVEYAAVVEEVPVEPPAPEAETAQQEEQADKPVEAEAPVEAEVPVEAELPVEPEVPVEAEVPVEKALPSDAHEADSHHVGTQTPFFTAVLEAPAETEVVEDIAEAKEGPVDGSGVAPLELVEWEQAIQKEDVPEAPVQEEAAPLPKEVEEPESASAEAPAEPIPEEKVVVVPQEVLSEVGNKGFWLAPPFQVLFTRKEEKDQLSQANKGPLRPEDEDDIVAVSRGGIVLPRGKRTV